MNEHTDPRMIHTPAHFPKALLVKWLRNLFYIQIVSIALSLISLLPIVDTWTVWVSRAVTGAAIVCFFQLAPAQERYRKAAIYKTVMLVVTLVNSLILRSAILVLVSSVCSIIAVYQEYSGHGNLIQDADPKLSRKWHGLFTWQVLISVLIAIATAFAAVLLTMSLGAGNDTASTVVFVVMEGVSLVLEVVYLSYLNRTIGLVQS